MDDINLTDFQHQYILRDNRAITNS